MLHACDIVHAVPVCHPHTALPAAVLSYVLLAVLLVRPSSFLRSSTLHQECSHAAAC